MGGIHPGNIGRVLEAGARRVAMITGITRASDIAARVRQLRKTISDYVHRCH
jgi:thiamine monophosphate synthase